MLNLSIIIFITAISGMLVMRKNIIMLLINLELLLLSINLNFINFSIQLNDNLGEIINIIILTIAATETAIGLSLIILLYRYHNQINLNLIKILKT